MGSNPILSATPKARVGSQVRFGSFYNLLNSQSYIYIKYFQTPQIDVRIFPNQLF